MSSPFKNIFVVLLSLLLVFSCTKRNKQSGRQGGGKHGASSQKTEKRKKNATSGKKDKKAGKSSKEKDASGSGNAKKDASGSGKGSGSAASDGGGSNAGGAGGNAGGAGGASGAGAGTERKSGGAKINEKLHRRWEGVQPGDKALPPELKKVYLQTINELRSQINAKSVEFSETGKVSKKGSDDYTVSGRCAVRDEGREWLYVFNAEVTSFGHAFWIKDVKYERK